MLIPTRRAWRWLAAACLATGWHAAWADDPLGRVVNGLDFDQFVRKTLADYAVPGAVVAVASADGTVSVNGYGVRERGRPAAIDPDTRFQIASMSKFIAATAIGTLVDAAGFQPVRSEPAGTRHSRRRSCSSSAAKSLTETSACVRAATDARGALSALPPDTASMRAVVALHDVRRPVRVGAEALDLASLDAAIARLSRIRR